MANEPKLECVKCNTELLELPFFNNLDEGFVPSIPFCPNPKCERHGLLTVAYFSKDSGAKSKRKAV